MKAGLFSTGCLLFVAAAASGCGSSANLAADSEDLGGVEQAFSEPNCINALPNSDGEFSGTRNPDGTFTGEMFATLVTAPYTNPKCGDAWAGQVNRAKTGLKMIVDSRR